MEQDYETYIDMGLDKRVALPVYDHLAIILQFVLLEEHSSSVFCLMLIYDEYPFLSPHKAFWGNFRLWQYFFYSLNYYMSELAQNKFELMNTIGEFWTRAKDPSTMS